VRRSSEKIEIGIERFIEWLIITASKFYDWRERYGKVNDHNGWVPPRLLAGGLEKARYSWLPTPNPLESYCRLTFMMLDANVVVVSPSSVWRMLGQTGLLSKWSGRPKKFIRVSGMTHVRTSPIILNRTENWNVGRNR
jgi:hypothetical protein